MSDLDRGGDAATNGTRIAVSVIMPAYNAGATIGAQIDALSRQAKEADLEVLVCDNGSSDETLAIARGHADPALRLRVIDASHRRGPSAARNTGAAQARGDLLLFCDADDVVEHGWVSAMTDALQVADLVAGSLDGRSLNRDNRASVSWEVSSEIRMPFWPRFGAGASSNLGIRARVFAAVGGFDETLKTAEDVDLCWRVQLAGYVFARSHDAVVKSRQRDGRCEVFHQARSYGAGSRALRVKYRHHIAEYDGVRAPEIVFGQRWLDPQPLTSRSLPRRALRTFTRTGQANLAWRLGETIGLRFGRVDPAVRPLALH